MIWGAKNILSHEQNVRDSRARARAHSLVFRRDFAEFWPPNRIVPNRLHRATPHCSGECFPFKMGAHVDYILICDGSPTPLDSALYFVRFRNDLLTCPKIQLWVLPQGKARSPKCCGRWCHCGR